MIGTVHIAGCRTTVRIVLALLVSGTAVAGEHCKPEILSIPAGSVKPVACHRAPKSVETAITSSIVKVFEPEHTHGKADVTFTCDGLGSQVKEIVIESGGGHSGTLEMWRAQLTPSGAYTVRGIHHKGASLGSSQTVPFAPVAGTVKLPGLETVRAAITATVAESYPPPPPNSFGGMSFSSSSMDFHMLVRLTDEDGRIIEKTFTGYHSSGDQSQFLGLEVAFTALAPIIELPTNPTPDVDRALFAERFVADAPHFDDPFYWWVKESLVEMAITLGTPATIPGLVTRLSVRKKDDRSEVDTRADAVKALIQITGWDPKGKTIEATAAQFAAACR